MAWSCKKIFALFGVLFLAICVDRLIRRRGRSTWLPQYDFIIVGGGAAGSVLANRLSANPEYTVLLLEAGVDDVTGGNPWMDIPLFNAANFFTQYLYWADMSESQRHAGKGLKNSQVAHLHGKVLGGSSSINMMIYARGSPADYIKWEELGAEGWSWPAVEPYFRRIEKTEDSQLIADGIGQNGLLHITKELPYHTMHEYILNASEELGLPINQNYNGKSMLGSALTQSMSHNGRRVSASTAYLKPVVDRRNLHILTESHVIKILTENKTAVGVEFVKDSQVHRVLSTREVILSAGTFNSPHLLLLSGIGPKRHLEEHQVEVVNDLAGVGQNLHDHSSVSENIFMDDRPGVSLSSADFSLSNIIEYFLHRTGLLAENPFTALTFLSLSNTTKPSHTASSLPVLNQGTSNWDTNSSVAPDIAVMYSVTPLGGLNPAGLMQSVNNFLNFSPDMVKYYCQNTMRSTGTALLLAVTHPKSRGSITLSSNDPFDRPNIDSNLLSHSDDKNTMRKALKFAHSLVHTKAMSAVGAYILDIKNPNRERYCSEYIPYSDEYLDCYMTYNSGTTFHAVGTCAMGVDSNAVVDPFLRVHGMKSLRVADASVMPSITSANTQAPTMMIAERAADFILADVKL